MRDHIQVYGGGAFRPLAPDPALISITDIAHALSNLCRFTGHVRRFYSVAQHSVYVSYQCDLADALHGLLHDAPEAYLIDLASPIKRQPEMKAYRQAEFRVWEAVCDRFGLSAVMPESVRRADEILLATEREHLMQYAPKIWGVEHVAERYRYRFHPVGPVAAKLMFLRRFRELTAPIPSLRRWIGRFVPSLRPREFLTCPFKPQPVST